MKNFKSILLLVVFMGVVSSQLATAQELLHEVKGHPAAAAFSLLDIDDNTHSLAAYKGKVVIVNFWATWCPPCRFELPAMEKAYQKLKTKDVVMLGINVGEDADVIFSFTADYPVTFPLLMDTDSKVIQAYPVIGLPTTFVIDPDGKIIYRAVGTREWDEQALIQKVLALKKKSRP